MGCRPSIFKEFCPGLHRSSSTTIFQFAISFVQQIFKKKLATGQVRNQNSNMQLFNRTVTILCLLVAHTLAAAVPPVG